MPKINSLDHYGRGITKVNEKIVFVKNALPDEFVNINIVNEKKNYYEAEVSEYLTKSKKRIEVNCPYYKHCGGCNIMHMSYTEQLVFKENKIKNIIEKYFNNNINVNKIVGSSLQFNYRNKVTFQVKNTIGFYKENSYELIKIDTCMIIDNRINKIIKYLYELNLSLISKITIRSGINGIMIIIETNDKNLNIDCLKNVSNSIYLKFNNDFFNVYGENYILEKLGKFTYVVSPDSFFQVNIDTCKKMYDNIKKYIGTNKKIIDLYCGTGSIGIYVSQDNDVIGIEKNKYAINDANNNAKINNLNNVKFLCGDSGKKLDNLDFNPDVIIVDPPRSGLNKETINNILKFKANKIIYVSCDPMTLVRDLKILNEYYNVKEITPYDMFPNTYHVESVCILERKDS